MKHIFITIGILFLTSLPYAMAANLETLIDLQAQQQRRDSEAQRRLGENIGNIVQQRGQRALERHAFEFFGTGAITPEKISQFSSMYPNVPPGEIYEIVGTIKSIRGTAPKEMTQQEKAKVYKELSDLVNEVFVKPTEGMTPQERREFHDRQQREWDRFIDDYYGIGR